MKKVILSILLIVIAIILAYYSAGYFGYVYNLLPATTDTAWIGSEGSWDILLGLPLSLIFFLTLFSYRLIFKSKQSVLWLLSPILLFEIASDLAHIYIPILLIIIAFALNNGISYLVLKNK